MSDAARAMAAEIFEAADGEPGEERIERALDAFAAEQTAALRTVVKARIQDEGAYLGLPDDKIDALILAVDRRLLAEAEGRRAEEEWRALKDLENSVTAYRTRLRYDQVDILDTELHAIFDKLLAVERSRQR